MADHTKIEWTDATWNPITGCSVASPGCTNCYAMGLAGTRLKNHPSREGLTKPSKAGPVWTGEVRLNEQWLDQPLRWSKPRMIFVCAHGDLFTEGVPDEWIDRVFAVMALAPQHTFQVLTKRAERMRRYVLGLDCDGARRFNVANRAGWIMERGDEAKDQVAAGPWPLPNVWLGVSVEDQRRANERIPLLLDTPAAVRWISAEPLLGPVDLTPHLWGRAEPCPGCPRDADCDCGCLPRHMIGAEPDLGWVVCGGESGRSARPMDPEWARSLRDQCADAGVPFLFKQWGEWIGAEELKKLPAYTEAGMGGFGPYDHCPFDMKAQAVRIGKKAAGRTLDGATHDSYPAGVA